MKKIEKMTPEEMYVTVKDSIMVGLKDFIGRPSGKKIVEESKLSLQRILSNMEADLFGYEIKKCDTLWNIFSLKQKIGWYWAKITGKSAKTRALIDEKNKVRYEYAVEQAETDGDPETSAFDYYERMDYPDWAQSNPKSMIRFETILRPNQAIEFVELSIQLDDVKTKEEV